jgi:flagellar protein FlaG
VAEEGAVEAKAARSSEAAQETEARPPAAPVVLPEFRQTELSFRIEESLNRVVIQVIDAKSGDVLRSIPPEDLIRMARNLRNVRGLLLDEEG